MRRLIVNADDFGLTGGVNRSIVEAHQHGIVTSATLMAGGPAFDAAVQLAGTAPRLSIGCHVVLVDGQPLLAGKSIPSLIAPGKQPPTFTSRLFRFAAASVTGRLVTDHIQAEATAQIRKLQDAGIQVSHVDTHKHTHMFPQVLKPLLNAAKACGIRSVRNPFEPPHLGPRGRQARVWKRWGQVRTLRALAPHFREQVQASGLQAPDGCLGIVATGCLDRTSLRPLLENLPEGTWELVCHPGADDDDLRRTGTRLTRSRQIELRLLTAPETRELIEQAGIQLISYRDFAAAVTRDTERAGTSGQSPQPAW